MDDELGAARERRIRDGIHVADDDVRPVARFTQGVRTAVDADEHRLEVPDVAADDAQIVLVTGAARDHEDMAVAEPRREGRELDSLREQPPFVP